MLHNDLGKITLLICVFLFATSPLFPQTPQNRVEEPIRLSTDLVVVDVQVLSKKTGAVVGELKKEDFLIYEDGIKQEISHFSRGKLPLSIILLLDLSGSVQPYIKQIHDGALLALQRLKAEDEVALAAFATSAKVIQDFTKDRQQIVNQIEQIKETAKVGSFTFLAEGVYQAAIHLRKASNPSSRRVIIVITDNISNQVRFAGHSERDALDELFEAGGVVCGLVVGLKGLRTMNKVAKYHPINFFLYRTSAVESFTRKTGGEVFEAKKENLELKLTELIDRLRTRYSIGYISSNANQDGRFRKLKIKLSPELKKQEGEVAVVTKQGYYARKGSDTGAIKQEKGSRP